MNNEFINIYADFLKRYLKPNKSLKVVFDCSNGTTGLILKRLLQSKIYNLKSFFINSEPDGNFPSHGPNPWAPDAINQLKKEVLRQKADLGIIFDADGDRVFFIDNLGCPVEPDIIARLLIWQTQPKKVVYDIRAGWLITKIQNSSPKANPLQMEKFKIQNNNLKLKIYKSKVGHYFIKKLMRKTNADLGVEKSGHYYFKITDSRRLNANLREKSTYYDDGALAAIKIISAVSRLPYALADFANLLPQYYRSGEINVKINQKSKNENYEYLLKKIENKYKKQAIKISHLDGLTIELNNWWFNLRPSNTEPLIRLNMEAENLQLLKNKQRELMKILKNMRPEND